MIKKFLRGILHFFMPRRSMAQLIEHYRSQGMKIGENCYIGHNVFIGVNAVVLPGVHIGDFCIIGAGAVVTKEIPPGSVAAGNPAKVIQSIENFKAKYAALYKEHPEYFYCGQKPQNQ